MGLSVFVRVGETDDTSVDDNVGRLVSPSLEGCGEGGLEGFEEGNSEGDELGISLGCSEGGALGKLVEGNEDG